MAARDGQINLRDGKAKVLFLNEEKAEPFGKMERVHFPKIEPVGKTEPLDFPKVEPVDKTEPLDFPKVELIGKTEPLDFPKIEPIGKAEPLDFPKVEPIGKTEPLNFPTTKTVKLVGQPLFGSKFLLLKLNRTRDFISLLLSYPMRTGHDSKLKVWTRQVSNGDLSEADLWRLQRQNPLRCLEGLIPMEMIMDIEAGASCIFADKNVIPEAILNLAADLAVHQLIQTLLSGDDHVLNLHHVTLSTRNGAEKRAVMEKIEAALKDNDNMLRLNETFSGVLLIDASMYQSQVEFRVRRQIARQLQIPMITRNELEGNDDWLITSIEKEMSRKKYLVLLVDGDVEEPLDPRKVGFPKEQLAGVVVLITTESPKQANNELTIAMDLKIKTEDHVLPWEVFCRHVGKDLVHSSSAIQTIAVQIVMECGSHLLALVLVAKSLKNVEDVNLWELALDKLHCPHPSYDISWFHGQSIVMVNAFINFIWDGMHKTQRHCLTLCLFIPRIKDGKIDNELLNDWISSLSVDAGEAENHLIDLLDRYVLLQPENRFIDLLDRYVLLQELKCDCYIRMPEDIYVILQSLNNHNPLFIRKAGLGLIEPPNSEQWHNAVHVELADNKLAELPSSPNCLDLKVLMLQGNIDLTKIPSLFFVQMPLLDILNLSFTSVRELPNSFFELEQLRELFLKGCECFMKLPSEIGKLKKLEKLDLDGTQIIHLPEEIQQLTNLERLILCFYEYRGKKSKQYTCSTIIPYGIITKLKGLKHLSIDVNPDDERWHENIPVILPEILELECLQTLRLYIPQLELLKLIPDHIFSLDFKFIVGRHMQRIISCTPPTDEAKFKQSDCCLKFVKGPGVSYEIKKLVRHSKTLFLDRHMTLKNLSEFGIMNLEQLQVCILVECKEMQTIIDERRSDNNEDILSHLLYLSVSCMKNLRSILEGQVQSSYSFSMLKSLALQSCPKLTTIFTLDFLSNLSLLKVLIVKDCPKIRTLISDWSSITKEEIFLLKLKKVLLLHLPELISISNGFQIAPSLENIGVYECPKLQSLSKTELSSQNLKVIRGEIKWWDALKWREVDWGKAGRPSIFNGIFYSIDKEADVMTQLGVYKDEDIDDCSGGSVDEPPQPLSDRVLGGQNGNVYRRRKTMPTWIKEGEVSEDGHSWRKYGQKEILGAKYPRDYYRCIHRNHRGCLATKQMQRIQEDPPLYRNTYRGHHTCKYLLNTKTILKSSSLSIDKEADVMTQLGVRAYKDEDVNNCPSGSMDEPPQPLSERVFGGQKRNAHRRRKTIPTWTKEGEVSEDGHSWRKYGQKDILGAKYPRLYYRCTHKIDQGCPATKHMQRLQEDPPLCRTIYYGHHTCGNLLNPNIILNSDSPSDSSSLLGFGKPFPTKQDRPFFSSIVKKECVEDNASSSSQLTADSTSCVTLSSTQECDYRDLYHFDDPNIFKPFEF